MLASWGYSAGRIALILSIKRMAVCNFCRWHDIKLSGGKGGHPMEIRIEENGDNLKITFDDLFVIEMPPADANRIGALIMDRARFMCNSTELSKRTARDTPVGGFWPFTEHRTMQEVIDEADNAINIQSSTGAVDKPS
jgi:hypothetical protein